MSNAEQSCSFNVNESLNLWSRFDYNLSRTFVWPLLSTKDALNAMIVNRATSCECDLWASSNRKWKNAELLEHLIDDKPKQEHVKFHDPSCRIHNIDLYFYNSISSDVHLLISNLSKWAYVTTLVLDITSLFDVTDLDLLFSTVTLTGGPLTKLTCLTHLTLRGWKSTIEVDSLPNQLNTLVLSGLSSPSNLVPGCIPLSVTLLDLHGWPSDGHQTFGEYRFADGCIPNSLKRLVLSSEGRTDWENAPGIFPDQLEYLKIELWQEEVPKSQILFPASLTELSVYGSWYDEMSFFDAFPVDSKLQRMYINQDFFLDPVETEDDDFASPVLFRLPDHLSHVEFKPQGSESFPVSHY